MLSQDLTGVRFSRLIVVREGEPVFRQYTATHNHKIRMFECLCDCGKIKTVRLGNLKSGHTTSCGCAQREAMRATGKLSNPRHGMFGTAEYRAWRNMKERCLNPKATRYERYGGRGIKVCDRWLNSFENFYADVGPRPSPQHSIDRYPDNDGNYEPTNVRWATSEEQQRNLGSNRLVVIDGQAMCVAQAAEKVGMSADTLRGRLHKGMSFEEALQTPLRR